MKYLEKLESGNVRCTLCGKITNDRRNMRRHIETHMEGLSYVCPSCNKVFRSNNSLQTHKRRFHGQKGVTSYN